MKTVSESRGGSAMAVFVLGMHRSGTSAITQAVKVLGFDLSDKLLPAKPDNVKGFWEDWDVVNLNEKILRSDTGSWDRLSLFDSNLKSPEELEQILSETTGLLQRKFDGVSRFVIKDPRISLVAARMARSMRTTAYRAFPYSLPPASVRHSIIARFEKCNASGEGIVIVVKPHLLCTTGLSFFIASCRIRKHSFGPAQGVTQDGAISRRHK